MYRTKIELDFNFDILTYAHVDMACMKNNPGCDLVHKIQGGQAGAIITRRKWASTAIFKCEKYE